MKISLNWLKEYITLDESPEKIAAVLTDIGLEVEKFEEVESIKGGLKGLVIGEIVEKEKHPGADKLSITKVNVGEKELLPIVCGAPNVAKGQKVVVATVNCTIHPSKGEPFKIKKAKIRGEVSQGMICAEDEIGLGNGHDGIMVLPKDAPVGKAANEYFELKTDTIFEIGLTPNRGDAASHFGVARDLAVHYGKKIALPSLIEFEKSEAKSEIKIELENETDCLKYCGITVKDIKVGDSPAWLKERLGSIGINSINNVVDVTNYVLHSIGQPIHAFDQDLISKNVIKVGKANKGDKFTTLDEKERELTGEELMIQDGKRNLAIAGVFGGVHSGVSENTKTVFIESACFNPSVVRKSAKLHGLNTDASFRYERGTDPEICEYAAKRTAMLLIEVAGGKVINDSIEMVNPYTKDFTIELSTDFVTNIVGETIPDDLIYSILNGLEIATTRLNETKIKCVVPAYRSDVTREIDLVEEILRFYGYNKVKIPKKVSISFSDEKENNLEGLKKNTGAVLRGIGFHEVMTNSLTSSQYFEDQDILVRLSNPLSSELDVMRSSMLPSGLEAVAYNIKRKNSNVKFFEWGTIYEKRGEKYIEKPQLMLICSGNTQEESWEMKDQKIDFFFIKSVLKQVAQSMHLPMNKIFNSKQVQVTEVSKKDCKRFGINQPVFFASLDLDLVKQKQKEFKVEALTKFPTVRRDLSLVIKKSVTFDSIHKVTKKVNQNLIKSINVFDVYEGKPLKEDEKSYSVSFLLENKERTLTDKEIDGVIDKLIITFEKELNAVIRR
jgi:phenylalanyl-tRNA synthetase beta chain